MDTFYKELYKPIETTSVSPIDSSVKCELINTKKNSFYIHKYNPKPLLKIFEQHKNYFPNMQETFDFTERSNCCNCVAISLYVKGNNSYNNLDKYLSSIVSSTKNIKKNLPDWLLRLYLDKSVYDNINNLKKMDPEQLNGYEIGERIIKYFDYLIHAYNVEIYTFVCPNINNNNIGRTRIYRFMPLIDKEVNVAAIREADGIISNAECFNLRLFEKSQDKFMYLVYVMNESVFVNDIRPYKSYSVWLTYYKAVFQNDYYSKRQVLYDLLAGTVTLKLKVKPSAYFKANNDIMEFIKNKDVLWGKNKSKAKYLGISNIHDLSNFVDEMLLMKLFQDYISVPFKKILNDKYQYDENELSIKKNLIYSFHNCHIISYDVKQDDLQTTINNTIKFFEGVKKLNIDPKQALSKEKKLIEYKSYLSDDENMFATLLIYAIDSLIVPSNVKFNTIIDIQLKFETGIYNNVTTSLLINAPYCTVNSNSATGFQNLQNYSIKMCNNIYYDEQNEQNEQDLHNGNSQQFGGYYYKYLKYKQKYLDLKKNFN